MKDEEARKLFQTVDTDGNGYISKDEFVYKSELFLKGRPARIILIVGGKPNIKCPSTCIAIVLKIFVASGPGSGKGLLCDRLVKECGVVHLSSGDLLRQEVEAGTRLGQEVKEIMRSGGLVSSAIMVALMQKRMKDHPGKRLLLDGFPR